MELHKLIEELQKEGISPEEVLKAVKQRKYTLQKIKEYQRKTYKKITVSIRKDNLKKLKEDFPEIDEKTLLKILAIKKLIDDIKSEIFQKVWENLKTKRKF